MSTTEKKIEIVCDKSGQKPTQVPFGLTIQTTDNTTSKIMWNSTISTQGTRYMCADAGNFYLATSLDHPEYMRIPVELVRQEFIDANNLASKIKNGYIYMKIICGIYGLPQSGMLAIKLLEKRLKEHDY